jgi:beta-lactamase regulating signal transducer with metallopeptidase domain
VTASLVTYWAATTLALLLVLAVRLPVARTCGAGWAYSLWLLPLLQPLLIALQGFGGSVSNVLPDPVIILPAVAGAAASSPSSGGPGQWVPLLLALWAEGAAVFLLVQLIAYRRLLGRLGAEPFAEEPVVGGIPVIESEAVDGPLALGLLRPRIAVPAGFTLRYTPAERRLALAHELVHHRRGDIWWNLAALILLALNWFNPIAWIAFRACRADQELACDAAVTRRAAPSDRHAYAHALVKSASRPGLIGACPLHHADQLKRRLKMMNHHRKSLGRSIGGGVAAAAVVLGGALLTPAAGAAAEEGAPVRSFLAPPVVAAAETPPMQTASMTAGDREAPTVRKKVLRFEQKAGEPLKTSEVEVREFPRECKGQRAETDVGTNGPQQDRIKVFICDEDGRATPAEMNAKLADALEKARDDVEKGGLKPADKEAMLGRMAEEIARLRGR